MRKRALYARANRLAALAAQRVISLHLGACADHFGEHVGCFLIHCLLLGFSAFELARDVCILRVDFVSELQVSER